MRAELAVRLGVAWGPVVKGQAEIAGVPADLLEAFSRRAAQIRAAVAAKAMRFRARHVREPSRREWAIIVRDAARESRPAKRRGRRAERLRADWLATAAAHGYDPHLVWTEVRVAGERARALGVGRWLFDAAGRVLRADERARERLGVEVVGALVVGGSAWTRADVEREVAARLPTVDGAGAVSQIGAVQRAAGEIIVSSCVDLAPAWARGMARAALEEPRRAALQHQWPG